MKSHVTVLLEEAVASLKLHKDSVVVDATYGAGGHAELILQQLSAAGTYIGIDVDETAFKHQPANPHKATIHLLHGNFKNLTDLLGSLHTTYSIDGILADLGWRMEQFEESGKGLSFRHDEPLLMTYGASEAYDFTAYDIVNHWEESVLADIIFGYGEERAARQVAKAIVSARTTTPIETTFQLRDVVESVLRRRPGQRTSPATKTFQALRIAVNEELAALEMFIEAAVAQLAPGGRLAIITFHSLEDRIVKHRFKELATAGLATVETKKPITPTEDEVTINPRARSAKLRVLHKNNVEQYEQSTTFTTRI